MLYKIICMMPPTTDRPATASLMPNCVGPAALLVDVALLEPLELPLELRVVGSSVFEIQFSFPWTLPLLFNELNFVQSITAVLWTFKAPTMLSITGKEGVVKFPERSTAPPTFFKAGKLMV